MLTFEVQRENCSSSIAAAALGRFGMSAHSTSGLRNSALHVPDNIYIMTTDAACRHPESVYVAAATAVAVAATAVGIVAVCAGVLRYGRSYLQIEYTCLSFIQLSLKACSRAGKSHREAGDRVLAGPMDTETSCQLAAVFMNV